MEWSDLRIFLALARTGTLGSAARSLGLSHPTIGRRIQALEAATGQRLFQRTVDGFVLTQEGASILAHAEQVEESALAIERRLSGADAVVDGTLRVTASDWFAAWMLLAVVASFSNRHPSVTVELQTGTRLYSLAHREADLAFRTVRFDEADVVQRRLLRIEFGVYAPVGAAVSLDDGGRGLALIEDVPTDLSPQVGWLKARLPEARTVLRSNSRTVQARMGAAGIGLVLLPRQIGDAHNELRRIEIGEAPPTRDVWMGYHRDLRTLRRLRMFVEAVTQVLVDG